MCQTINPVFASVFLAVRTGDRLPLCVAPPPPSTTTTSATNTEVKNLLSLELKSCLVAACAAQMKNFRMALEGEGETDQFRFEIRGIKKKE